MPQNHKKRTNKSCRRNQEKGRVNKREKRSSRTSGEVHRYNYRICEKVKETQQITKPEPKNQKPTIKANKKLDNRKKMNY